MFARSNLQLRYKLKFHPCFYLLSSHTCQFLRWRKKWLAPKVPDLHSHLPITKMENLLTSKTDYDCIIAKLRWKAHSWPWASEGFFPVGASRVFSQNFFQGGAKVVKFGFYPSKLKKLFLLTISQSGWGTRPPCPPFPWPCSWYLSLSQTLIITT